MSQQLGVEEAFGIAVFDPPSSRWMRGQSPTVARLWRIANARDRSATQQVPRLRIMPLVLVVKLSARELLARATRLSYTSQLRSRCVSPMSMTGMASYGKYNVAVVHRSCMPSCMALELRDRRFHLMHHLATRLKNLRSVMQLW